MNATSRLPRCLDRRLVAAFLALSTASSAGAAAPRPDQQIVVQDSYYVFANRSFDDLGELVTAVREVRPAALELDACGPSAIRAFMRAVPRFGDLTLYLQVLDAGAAACTMPAAVPGSRQSAETTQDDRVADRYWAQVMP